MGSSSRRPGVQLLPPHWGSCRSCWSYAWLWHASLDLHKLPFTSHKQFLLLQQYVTDVCLCPFALGIHSFIVQLHQRLCCSKLVVCVVSVGQDCPSGPVQRMKREEYNVLIFKTYLRCLSIYFNKRYYTRRPWFAFHSFHKTENLLHSLQ